MFKSVFAKYIFVFMLITMFSFSLLTTITVTVVDSYLTSAKSDVVIKAANAAKYCISERYKKLDGSPLSIYIDANYETVGIEMRAVANLSEDLTIVLTDINGEVLLANTGTSTVRPNGVTIPPELLNEFDENIGEVLKTQSLKALGEGGYRIAYSLVISSDSDNGDSNNLPAGRLFVFASSDMLDAELQEVMLKTIFMSSLWVMLATLIAVYFITDRVISPLRQMNKAAKSFADGDFTVRVPVKGRDEVAQLAEAFNNMAKSLESSDKMRTTFVANVSHDLRTPMTTISGFIDGILAGAIPPDKHDYYLGIIAEEVRRLSRLVAQLLDVSRLQAGDRKFNMQPFDVCEMARQILISFEQKIDKKRLEVDVDFEFDNMFVNADRDAIYQILYNICDNAVKFSEEGGALRLAVRALQGTKISVSVYNEGIGIPAEDLPFVFERFYKGDKSRGLDKTGVGLGMFIAKTIIDAHHEKINVESEYGKYCRFTFTLAKVSPERK